MPTLPPAPAPADTLRLACALDVDGLPPGETVTVHAVLELTARGDGLDRHRPDLSVAFVLDASGSMHGEPLQQVVDSVGRLADLLGERDRAAVITFAENPAVVSPLHRLDAGGKAGLRRRLAGIRAAGSTGMTGGVRAARAELPARAVDERQVLVLLSDGNPTDGATPESLAELARGFRPDVSAVALGFGPAHNADLMKAFASGGGGLYYYIPDPAQAAVEFARAVGAQGDVVVDGVELLLRPAPGVEVAEVLGEPRLRFGSDGLVVPAPDLRDGQAHAVVVRLTVRADREVGRRPVLEVAARYRRVGEGRALQAGAALDVAVRRGPPSPIAAAAARVGLARAELVRGEARRHADAQRYDAAARLVADAIAALEAQPSYRAMDGSPLAEAVEQLRDELVVYQMKPTAMQYREFKAHTLGFDVAQGGSAADQHGTGALAQRTMAAALDADVDGEVEVRDPSGGVTRVPLRAEMVLGRTGGCELPLPAPTVSRRHARLQCQGGAVHVHDCGSTGGILVNARRVASAVLGPGDELDVGGFRIRVVRRR